MSDWIEKEYEKDVMHQVNLLMGVMDMPECNENEIQRQLGILYHLWSRLKEYQENN